MSTNPSEPDPETQPDNLARWDSCQTCGRDDGTRRRSGNEAWTITFAFAALDDSHAHAVAQHAARRLATVLPDFDKNAVVITRETSPFRSLSVYCDNDIYCALKPRHQGPCRSQDGANLDLLDIGHGDTPAFGAEL